MIMLVDPSQIVTKINPHKQNRHPRKRKSVWRSVLSLYYFKKTDKYAGLSDLFTLWKSKSESNLHFLALCGCCQISVQSEFTQDEEFIVHPCTMHQGDWWREGASFSIAIHLTLFYTLKIMFWCKILFFLHTFLTFDPESWRAEVKLIFFSFKALSLKRWKS